ncbi:hypothetical protein [Brevibacterium litoralis]|uniref:hypothetical protein n=1 Tax=Brevibacterium litoralis TaxID=3138935 RepID=UPI0032EB8239
MSPHLPRTQDELDELIKTRLERDRRRRTEEAVLQPLESRSALARAIQKQSTRITELADRVDRLTVKLTILLDRLDRKDRTDDE